VSRIGHFLFRYRNALFPCAFLLVFLPGPRVFDDQALALAVGAMIAALGELVRALTIGLKYIVRGGRERRVYARDLVTDGLYAHSRNPMYIGNLLILTGVAVASDSWTCVAIAVPLFTFFYLCIVAAEEEFLQGRFGAAFEEYSRDVPRWGPKLRGLGRTLRASRFHWRRLLVKEYGTACAWIGGLCVLGLFHLQAGGSSGHDVDRNVLLAMLVASAIVWVCAWALKKSHVIVAD
jgi:protein-S-isoprenylcysteine O-methyltransferase Ste14